MSKPYKKFVTLDKYQIEAIKSIISDRTQVQPLESAIIETFTILQRFTKFAPSTLRKKWQEAFKDTKFSLPEVSTTEKAVKSTKREPLKTAIRKIKKKIKEVRKKKIEKKEIWILELARGYANFDSIYAYLPGNLSRYAVIRWIATEACGSGFDYPLAEALWEYFEREEADTKDVVWGIFLVKGEKQLNCYYKK